MAVGKGENAHDAAVVMVYESVGEETCEGEDGGCSPLPSAQSSTAILTPRVTCQDVKPYPQETE